MKNMGNGYTFYSIKDLKEMLNAETVEIGRWGIFVKKTTGGV